MNINNPRLPLVYEFTNNDHNIHTDVNWIVIETKKSKDKNKLIGVILYPELWVVDRVRKGIRTGKYPSSRLKEATYNITKDSKIILKLSSEYK